MPDPVTLTPKDLAVKLQVHSKTILRWIRDGKLPAPYQAERITRKTYRIRLGDDPEPPKAPD